MLNFVEIYLENFATRCCRRLSTLEKEDVYSCKAVKKSSAIKPAIDGYRFSFSFFCKKNKYL